jgi:hypothetical protein
MSLERHKFRVGASHLQESVVMEGFTIEEVIKLARGRASLRGATTPISIEHVLTDQGAALGLLRPDMVVTGGVELCTPVYAVLIRGSFPPRPVPQQDSRHSEREIPVIAAILCLSWLQRARWSVQRPPCPLPRRRISV